MAQKYKTSALFHTFLKNLNIDPEDNEVLQGVRKEFRHAIRGNFNQKFKNFLDEQKHNQLVRASLNVAEQLSEEKVKFLTQGSFSYKTLNKPQHTPTQQMDLDDGVYFRMSNIDDKIKLNSSLLFSYIEQQISPLVEIHNNWKMKKKSTCVRVEIDDEKHIDLPLYIVPDEEFLKDKMLARQTHASLNTFNLLGFDNIYMAHRKDDWVQSDPRKIIKWVEYCTGKYGRYRELCRIIKAWRDHQWKESPWSSICIMRMVDMALASLSNDGSEQCEFDLLLYHVIRCIYQIVCEEKEIADPDNTISKRLDTDIRREDRIDMEKRLGKLIDVMHSVLFDEESQSTKNRKLKQQFGKFFPDNQSDKISPCSTTPAAPAAPIVINKPERPWSEED